MSRILILTLACIGGLNAGGCPANEHQTRCGPQCEPSCVRAEPKICYEECLLPGCSCKPGFFRNSKAVCVRDCSKEPCGENMERRQCGLPEGCEPLCIPSRKLKCENKCVKNGCHCKSGYIRDSPGGECISMEMCNTKRNKQTQA